MERIFSLLNTIFGTLLSVASFLGIEGAKSAGCNRLMSFSERKRRQSSGGPFDNPFDKSANKRDDFLQGPRRPSRIKGHSIGNPGLASSGRGEMITDYSKLNAKDEYARGLKADYMAACVSGLDHGIKTQKVIKRPTSLPRGQAVPGIGGSYERHDHNKLASSVTNMNLRGTSQKLYGNGYQGPSNKDTGAGKRAGTGPGGISHRSVRNSIKF